MKNQLELTRTFYPEQLYIELSEQQMIKAWKQAEKNFQNDIIRWRAYLNYLVVEAIPQIKSELGLEEKVGYYPSDLSKVLEFINGTILTLGETRLVVIPSDSNIGGDLCVPQELVDLPGFAGDYYLGVYIDLEEEWLRFWGACSHKKLTTEGVYDKSTRNYYLDRDELIEDLEAVLIAREICPKEIGAYKFVALPRLSESQSEGLVIKLTQWFEGIFTIGWQTVEELSTPQFQLRSAHFAPSVQRGKQIDLTTHTVNLVISLTREDADKVIVNLKVFTIADIPYLPPNLKLVLLVEGEVFKEITSSSVDRYIHYEFDADPGDEFMVKLILGEAEITEDFVV